MQKAARKRASAIGRGVLGAFLSLRGPARGHPIGTWITPSA